MELEQLRSLIRELIEEEEIDELSATGNVAGYKTPHAFQGTDEPDDEYVDKINKSTGYTRVNEENTMGASAFKSYVKKHGLSIKKIPGKSASPAYTVFKNGKKLGVIDPSITTKSYMDKLINESRISRSDSKRVNESKSPSIAINKKEYDKLQSGKKVVVSRLSTGFNHNVNPQYYKRYPKNLKSIEIINPRNKKREVVKVDKVEHEDYGVYLHLIKESLNERRIDRKDSKRANELYDIIQKKKAGRDRTEAVKELAKIAQKYSNSPIRTMNDVLLTLDFIEPVTPGGHQSAMNKKFNMNEEYRNRWLELKKSDQTPNQKIGIGVRKIRRELAEMEKFVRWYSKIRKMNELGTDDYWKRTQKHLTKIKERLIGFAKKIQELEAPMDDLK